MSRKPALISRILSALTGRAEASPQSGYVAVQAQFEAARFTPDRSILPGYVQDARQDVTSDARIELLRRYRYFEKNNDLVQKILDQVEINVVGSGIRPTPSSSSPAFNTEALAYWNAEVKRLDLTGRHGYYAQQSMMARAEFGDGEIFLHLTHDKDGNARTQLIEGHRVVSANLRQYQDLGFTDVDGVLVDSVQRPAFYSVAMDSDCFGVGASSHAVIPADTLIHVFSPSRPGQYRGITNFHAVLHTLHDLDDLQKYEMLAAKDASSRANVITTQTGELPSAFSGVGKPKAPRTPGVEAPEVERLKAMEQAFGGKTVSLKAGEDWKQSENERPSAATSGFWAQLERRVCRGVGISYAAITDYENGWGGAALRGAVLLDARFFEARSSVLELPNERTWEHVIGDAILKGKIKSEAPKDWRVVVWHGPRRGTVDIGRDSNAMRAELDAGLRTRRDIAGENAGDWKEIATQLHEEEKFIAQLKAQDAEQSGVSAGASAGAADAGDVQATALNGAQVQALVELAKDVAAKQLPSPAAKAIAQSCFPLIPSAQIDSIFNSMDGFAQPVDQPQQKVLV